MGEPTVNGVGSLEQLALEKLGAAMVLQAEAMQLAEQAGLSPLELFSRLAAQHGEEIPAALQMLL